ncbi:GFA family protein (plasmid) [Streptomyces sp. NBC_01456]|uniref:GFA family protein n=1 Tax=unclassified Streptomyces TaxID=2593676 RepID=UPI002E308FF2|nr:MULTISPECIES: GFA family protein [unclassified Streptomyces]
MNPSLRTTTPASDDPALPPAALPVRPAPVPGAAAAGLEPERRTGHCQCGDIAYEVLGTPDDPHLCSCEHETRISGGPAVLWVGFHKNGLKWTGPGGEPTWFATYPTLKRGFCPRCGTHLVSVANGSDMVMVTGFSLDDRSGTDPVGHSFREEAVPWMNITLATDPCASQPAAP